MAQSKIIKQYAFSQSLLPLKTLAIIGFMRRDADQFLAYGITNDLVAALEADATTLTDQITDKEALADQMIQTEVKKNAADLLRTIIKSIMISVGLKYANTSARYKQFGAGNISRIMDADLLLLAKKVNRIGTPLIPELKIHGLTQEKLDELQIATDAYEEALIEQHIKIGQRDIAQEDRITFANNLYATLTKYASTGQSIWETRSPAKYNDYILYASQADSEEKEL